MILRSLTPKSSRHNPKKAKYYPNTGFLPRTEMWIGRWLRLQRRGGGTGAERWRLLGGLTAGQHQMEQRCGETDNWDGKKERERSEKHRNVFLISAKWDRVQHHIILVKVCRRSPQLRHLNLGPVLDGCCPLLISLSLWPQCLLALLANYQPRIDFSRGLSCPPGLERKACTCVQDLRREEH